MAGKELVQARVREAAAQRRYDFAVVVLTTLMTVIAVATPASVAVLLYGDALVDKANSALSANAEEQRTRAEDYIRECLTGSEQEAIKYYCAQAEEQAKRADDVTSTADSEGDSKWRAFVYFTLMTLVGAAIAVGVVALLGTRHAARSLTAAQELRIQLEARGDRRRSLGIAGRRE